MNERDARLNWIGISERAIRGPGQTLLARAPVTDRVLLVIAAIGSSFDRGRRY